jgi:hypothetical protein
MNQLPKMIGLLMMGLWATTASCASKVPNVPASDATVQCHTDCVQVSKAFLKEHADLFDEVIRTKSALKLCQEKK